MKTIEQIKDLAGHIRPHNSLEESILLFLGQFAASKKCSIISQQSIHISCTRCTIQPPSFFHIIVFLNISQRIGAFLFH